MTARILVVDDVAPNVKLLESKLMREYFDVLTANSGPEALKLLVREMPDLVLLDVMMPGMDGFEVCRRIKEDPATSHIPVIMVTALDEPGDKVRGLEAGADDFLTKPVEDVALYARVRSLVRLKVMMDELRNRELTGSMLGIGTRRKGDAEAINNAHILLIHQGGDELDALKLALGEFGRVTVDDGSDESGEMARRHDYDLIIVSLNLPGRDGLRIASRIRSYKETRQNPILVIAGQGENERVIRALDIGVNDYLMRPIDEMELRARSRTQILRKRSADRLRESFHMSVKLATSDAVTGLHNRHYLSSHLATMIHRAATAQKPFSVMMLDIDFFKRINDSYGHSAGDEVLREFAKRISVNIRGIDLAARYGGEEFVVIMPETPMETALMIAERLRKVVALAPFNLSGINEPVAVTVSIGVASYIPGDNSADGILERADDALYRAKRGGRNRVEVAQPAGGGVKSVAAD